MSTDDCGCSEQVCTAEILDTLVTDNVGTFSCRERIDYIMTNMSQSEQEACTIISKQFPNVCGQGCNPETCHGENSNQQASTIQEPNPPTEATGLSDCGCGEHCTDHVLSQIATDQAGSYTCRDRIVWVMQDLGQSEREACLKVSKEFPATCGRGCNPDSCTIVTSTHQKEELEKRAHGHDHPFSYEASHSPPNKHTSSHRVKSWISQMSLKDKIGQMSQIDVALILEDGGVNGTKVVNEQKMQYYFGELGIGSLLNNIVGEHWSAQEFRKVLIKIQEIAREYKRPPVIWGLDSIHGANYIEGAILSPQPINLAATFNVSMAKLAGEMASRDTRAAGMTWLFSPLLGIALEPNWSRVYETFGEDPLLVSDMASAMIEGIQQVDSDTDVIPSRAAACAKHFVGYSKPLHGHDRSPSWIPTRHLYNYFVPPWKKALGTVNDKKNALPKKALTVMESYTETNGVPNVANRQFLYGLLRHQLGFDGVLVTDYSEILNLHAWHHIASSDAEATVHALREGSVDMSMIPLEVDGFRSAIVNSAQKYPAMMGRIDTSVERVLHLKEQLGMMDEELTMENANFDRVGEGREDALDMATQGIVLVQNNNDILPLSTDQDIKIHVTGPTSNSLRFQSGGWTGQWQGAPSDEDGWFTYGTTVVEAMGSTSASWHVTVSCGVDILGNQCSDEENKRGWKESSGIVDTVEHWIGMGDDHDDDSIHRASDQASHADYVVVCVGEEDYTEKPGDVRSLALANGQYELMRAIKKTDKPVILVYFGGRPRLLHDMVDLADAVLIGFLPGPDAGRAVVNLIAGISNPSGRLPITYPQFEDGAGGPYFHAVSDQCTSGQGPLPHFDYVPCQVQWPFGHGLSYTTFEYSDVVVDTNKLHYRAHGQDDRRKRRAKKIDDTLTVSVNVQNTGSRAGSDVVMFFTFDESRQVTPEYKRLRAFEKVALEPNETKTVTATIHVNDLVFVGAHDDHHFALQHGLRFQVGVGHHSDCRAQDADATSLCSDHVTIDAGNDYGSGACDAACNLWAESGCDGELDVSPSRCWDMCTNDHYSYLDGNDGWGWNYVNCIESILHAHGDGEGLESSCWKMITLCRNIFASATSAGPVVVTPSSASDPDTASVVASVFAGMVGCAAIIVAFLRGRRRKRDNGWTQDEGDILITVRGRVDSEDVPLT